MRDHAALGSRAVLFSFPVLARNRWGEPAPTVAEKIFDFSTWRRPEPCRALRLEVRVTLPDFAFRNLRLCDMSGYEQDGEAAKRIAAVM